MMQRHLEPDSIARRAFLRRAGQLAVAGAATPLGLNLAAMGEAAAFTASDYKALVCVFLYGGNDHANTVVTYDSANWDAYKAIRGGLAVDRAALAATALTPTAALAEGRQYALHPSMTGVANLFNTGAAAVLLNVGPLVQPTTLADYYSPDRVKHPLPPQLMSHNDQQSVWQAQDAEGATVGWGGAIGDIALGNNTNASFTCISASGNAVFLSGDTATQYQVSRAGAVAIRAARDGLWGVWNDTGSATGLTQLITQTRRHVLENEYTRLTRRAIQAERLVSEALRGVTLTTPFPQGNPLAADLRIVARLVGARAALGAKRQVFLVSLGGFDLHDNLAENQPGLLTNVSGAMSAFQAAMVELGVAGSVTAFTASDFGRTLTINGNGTDHGWGSHHLVVGSAVRGAAFYGRPPPTSVGETDAPVDQWHVGQGRLLPSTSVDQYAATLARWFGVGDTELNAILPNLRNFGGAAYPTNLGFMA